MTQEEANNLAWHLDVAVSTGRATAALIRAAADALRASSVPQSVVLHFCYEESPTFGEPDVLVQVVFTRKEIWEWISDGEDKYRYTETAVIPIADPLPWD